MHRFGYRGLAGTLDARLANLASILYDLRARNELRGQQDAVGFERLKQAAVIESVRGDNAIEGIVTTKDRLAELMQVPSRIRMGSRRLSVTGMPCRRYTLSVFRRACRRTTSATCIPFC